MGSSGLDGRDGNPRPMGDPCLLLSSRVVDSDEVEAPPADLLLLPAVTPSERLLGSLGDLSSFRGLEGVITISAGTDGRALVSSGGKGGKGRSILDRVDAVRG